MEATTVPPVAYVAFAIGWLAGLGFFGGLYLVTRRLGMEWNRSGLSVHLGSGDAVRIFKLLWGFEPAPDTEVGKLVWITRALWAVMLVMVLVFILLLTGAV